MKNRETDIQNILVDSNRYLKAVKRMTILPCILVSAFLGHSDAEPAVFVHDLNVGTAADDLREVNWGPRVGQAGGGWNVSSESFLGFTLTSLLDGTTTSKL